MCARLSEKHVQQMCNHTRVQDLQKTTSVGKVGLPLCAVTACHRHPLHMAAAQHTDMQQGNESRAELQ